MVPAAKVKMPLWSVSFPFSDEDQQRVDRQIAAMPVPIWSITVGTHGSITNLDVGLPTPDAAYQDLVSVIATTGAGPTHAVGGWDGGWKANQASRHCNSKEWSTRADARMEPAQASFTPRSI